MHKNFLIFKKYELDFFKSNKFDFSQNNLVKNFVLKEGGGPQPTDNMLNKVMTENELDISNMSFVDLSFDNKSRFMSGNNSRISGKSKKLLFLTRKWSSRGMKNPNIINFTLKLKLFYSSIMDYGYLVIVLEKAEVKIMLQDSQQSAKILINDIEFLMKILRILMLDSKYL